MPTTNKVSWIFRQWFHSLKEGEEATPENINKQFNELKSKGNEPGRVGKSKRSTSFGLGALFLGFVLAAIGANRDDSVFKVSGGAMAVGGALLAGIGKFVCGVDLKVEDPHPAPSPTIPPPPKELTGEQKKEAAAILDDLLKTPWGGRAEILKKIKDKGYNYHSVTLLLSSLERAPFEDGLEKFIVALGDLGDSRAVKPLLAILKNENGVLKNLSTFITTLNAIDKIGDKSATKDLLQYLKNVGHYYTAEVCGHTLGHLADESIQDELISISELDDSNKQLGAVVALGYIKSAKSRETLIKCLNGKFAIPNYAAKALIRQKDIKSLLPLINIYFSKYQAGDDIVDISELKALDPDINVVITALKESLNEIKLEPTKNDIRELIEKLEAKPNPAPGSAPGTSDATDDPDAPVEVEQADISHDDLEASVKQAIEDLKNEDRNIRDTSVCLLDKIGRKLPKELKKQIIPTLLEVLQNERDENIGKSIGLLLDEMTRGFKFEDLNIQTLLKVLENDQNASVRLDMTVILDNIMSRFSIGEDLDLNIQILSTLSKVLEHEQDTNVKQNVADLLDVTRLHVPTEVLATQIPIFLKVLETDQASHVRYRMAVILCTMAHELRNDLNLKKQIAPTLLKVLQNDQSKYVRDRVSTVLRLIRVNAPEDLKAQIETALENVKKKEEAEKGNKE